MIRRNQRRTGTLGAGIALALAAACGVQTYDEDLGVGAKLSVDYLGDSDVVGFHYLIERVSCNPGDPIEPFSFEALVDLQDQLAPSGVTVLGLVDGESGHIFADVFVSLDPGCYDVTATPVSEMDAGAGTFTASSDCAAASADGIEVLDEQTTDAPLLVSQCDGDPNGAGDFPAALNHPPEVEVTIPDKFGFTCEVLEACASVSDVDNDPLEVEWAQSAGSALFEPISVGALTQTGQDGGVRRYEQCAQFVSDTVGEYEFVARVYDLLGDGSRIEDALEPGQTSHAELAFPLNTSLGVEPYCVEGPGVWIPLGQSIQRAPGCSHQTPEQYYCDPANAAVAGFDLADTCPGGTFDEYAAFPVCAADPCETVEFTDATLEAAVRAAIGVPTGTITGTDMLGLTVLSENNAGITNLVGLECAPNLTALLVSGNDIADISPLEDLTLLDEVNLSFNAGISDLSPLANSTGMEDLRVSASGGLPAYINDLSPLAGMTQLRVLYVSGHDIADLSPLAGKPDLEFLLANDNEITDLAPLATSPALFVLNVARNAGIDDLSPIAGATGMEELDVAATSTQPSFITDLSPLAGMLDMRTLTASGHDIEDISALAGMTDLTIVRLHANAIDDLGPLTGHANLQQVWVQWNAGIDDLSPLAASTGMLEIRADTTAVQTSYIADLSPVSGMNDLRMLGVGGHEVTDLSPLAGKTDLRNLLINSNLVTDLSPLSGLPLLTQLWAQFNPGIDDISPLAASTGMIELRLDTTFVQPSYVTDISVLSSFPNLRILQAGGHEIADLSALSGLTQLSDVRLQGNLVTDTTPLAGQCGISVLWLQNNSYTCPDATIDSLEMCGVSVNSDCP